jgi:hypothetical protein
LEADPDSCPATRRRAVPGVLVLAAIVGVWMLGAIPTPARVTVERCSVTYTRQEEAIHDCQGRWNRGLGEIQGKLLNVDADGWQVTSENPDQSYHWQLAITSNGRQWALAAFSRAYVVSAAVVWGATMLIVLLLASIVVGVGRVRRWPSSSQSCSHDAREGCDGVTRPR